MKITVNQRSLDHRTAPVQSQFGLQSDDTGDDLGYCTVLNRARVNEGGGWGTNSQAKSKELSSLRCRCNLARKRKLSMGKRIEEK